MTAADVLAFLDFLGRGILRSTFVLRWLTEHFLFLTTLWANFLRLTEFGWMIFSLSFLADSWKSSTQEKYDERDNRNNVLSKNGSKTYIPLMNALAKLHSCFQPNFPRNFWISKLSFLFSEAILAVNLTSGSSLRSASMASIGCK